MPVLGIDALRGTIGTRRRELVDVPEWGGEVLLQEVSGGQRAELMEGMIDLYQLFVGNETGMPNSGADFRKALEYAARVVQMTWINEAGAAVVAPDQVDLLLQQNPFVIFDLAKRALTLSQMAPSSVAEAKKDLPPT